MSFSRSRIAPRLLRALFRKSDHPVQLKGLAVAGSLDTQLVSSHRESLLPTAQVLLKGTWAFLESKRMASTIFEPTSSTSMVEEKANGKGHAYIRTPKVIFVLGGPGSGKGTQCALIVEHFRFTHLSAGDLLRAEINSGNENGMMIQSMIKEGKIVPSELTVKLLQNAMLKSGNNKFLIDGFPRNDENRATFELVTGIRPEFILFFDCTEEEMERRLLGRNQGRVDDNIETIRKRFKVFVDSSLPVINHYESFGKVRKIDAVGTREEVFESVRNLFAPFSKEGA